MNKDNKKPNAGDETLKPSKRKLEGVVVSDSMDKTVVVKVDSVKIHKKFGKRMARSKKYKAHDEKNICKPGDNAVIVECRPISKDKKWRVVYGK